MSYIININKIVRESKISEKKERRKKKEYKAKICFQFKGKEKRRYIYIYVICFHFPSKVALSLIPFNYFTEFY